VLPLTSNVTESRTAFEESIRLRV